MATYRKTAVMVGILFIIGTVSGILAGVFTAPIQAESTYPLIGSASETQWIIGTLFILLMGLSLAMIPALLYPVLIKHNAALALGYFLFRGALETLCVMIHVIGMFKLLTLSQIYGKMGAADATYFQTLGSLHTGSGEWIQMIGGIVFSLGALMVYALFYQTGLIPRWLSAWGFIGAVLYFISNFVSLFGPLHLAPSIDSGIGQLMGPLALQEMVFALWLIMKGFNPLGITALSTRQPE